MKSAKGHGFLLSLIINMLFRSGWLVLVAILLILHFAIHWPLWLIVIPIAIWFVHSLLITLLLSLGSRSGSAPTPVQENKNPYSAKNKDLF